MNEDRLKIIELQLVELERQKSELLVERKALLGSNAISNGAAQHSEVLSTDQKVRLFMSLFKGRTDVFANRWKNTQGRSGYSVACDNEWVPNICNKPKVKCMDCTNQRFTPINEQVIYQHLAGKKIIGIYPLLKDNNCHFFAVDFDKNDWKEAVIAASKSCLELNIPYLIEISQSGQGAHLWVFFSDSVPAKDARLLGFSILDKAMESYPNLSFDSYDRLFPNQDLMPEGGFGNLIALPMQLQARKKGHTEFVDNELRPHENLWHLLNEVSSVSPKILYETLARAAPRTTNDELHQSENLLPWEQSAKAVIEKIQHVPAAVTITLANHIYLKIDDLPAPLIARARRLASFSNPVFFKTQAMRFSTHGIPRYISCARIEKGPEGEKWLSLPRGCYDDLFSLLKEQGVEAKIDDKRNEGDRLTTLKFLGKLRKDQTKAVNAIVKHDNGVLHAPTAFGKTVTAIGIIKKRKTNTLILTHSKQLLSQWQERLHAFLEGVEVGVFHGAKKKPSRQIDVATYQSLINKKDNTVNEIVQDYGQIIIDECHHISAPSFEMVLSEVCAWINGDTLQTGWPSKNNFHDSRSDSSQRKTNSFRSF